MKHLLLMYTVLITIVPLPSYNINNKPVLFHASLPVQHAQNYN